MPGGVSRRDTDRLAWAAHAWLEDRGAVLVGRLNSGRLNTGRLNTGRSTTEYVPLLASLGREPSAAI